jgi:hypothetical protein
MITGFLKFICNRELRKGEIMPEKSFQALYIKPGEVIVVFLYYDGTAVNAAFSFIFYTP